MARRRKDTDTVAFRISQLSPEAREKLESSGNRSKFIRDSIEYYVRQHRLVAEKLDCLLQVAAQNSEILSRLLKAPLPHPEVDSPSPAAEEEQVEKDLFSGLQAFDEDENGEQA